MTHNKSLGVYVQSLLMGLSLLQPFQIFLFAGFLWRKRSLRNRNFNNAPTHSVIFLIQAKPVPLQLA
jgi:hypothetical protein